MPLTVQTLRDKKPTDVVVPGQRLYLADDRQTLVARADPRARFLWCTEYSEVTVAEAKRVNLEGYLLRQEAHGKQKHPVEDKELQPQEDKTSPALMRGKKE